MLGAIAANRRRGGGSLPDGAVGYAPNPTGNVFDFQGLSHSAYQRVAIYLDSLTVDTADTDIHLRFYIAGSLISSGYTYMYGAVVSDTNTTSQSSASASAIRLIDLQDAGAGLSFNGRLEICHPAASVFKIINSESNYTNSANDVAHIKGGGGLGDTGAITGFRISGNGGLITGGSCMIMVYPTS